MMRAALTCLLLLAWASLAVAHQEPAEEIAGLSAQGRLSARDHLRRGELLRLERDWERALADYDAAARIGAPPADVVPCRAALALDRGRPDEALELLRPLLVEHPRHERALELSVDALEALGRTSDAIDGLDRWIALTKRPAPEHYLRRARLVRSLRPGNEARALQGLDQGIARIGSLLTLESEAIQIEIALGRPDAALRRLERIAPVLAPHEALERRGAILIAAGRDAEARVAFAMALAEIEAIDGPRRYAALVTGREARLRAALEGRSAEEAVR